MVFMSSRRKLGNNFSFNSKKSRCITVNSHFNSSESNNLNASNSDDVIENSNIPCINVHIKNLLNKIITLQKDTDTQAIIGINDEITDDNNICEKHHVIKIQIK